MTRVQAFFFIIAGIGAVIVAAAILVKLLLPYLVVFVLLWLVYEVIFKSP